MYRSAARARRNERGTARPEPAAARPVRRASAWSLSGVPPYPIQAKLKVGAANDASEREADHVADQVMRSAAPVPATAATADGISRKCAGCAEEEARRSAVPAVRMAPASAAGSAGPAAEAAVRGLGSGTSLSPPDRQFFESRFGRDFSNVRIHAGSEADTASRALDARAFTLGGDIAFAKGEYRPGTESGRRLIAHELVHTLQQGEAGQPAVQRQQQAGTAHELSEADCASADSCDFKDGAGAATGKFTLTIYADKEGPFLLVPLTSGVGHSWLRLENDKGDYWTYGFWPQTGFDSSQPFAPVKGCVHSPDKAHAKSVTSSQTFELTAAQFQSAYDYAVATCKSRPDYTLFSYNCTEFVRQMVDKAGQGSFGGFGLVWESPNALDAWMRVHSWQIGLNLTAAGSTLAGPGHGAGSFSFDMAYRHQFLGLLGQKLRLYGLGHTELGPSIKTAGAGLGAAVDPQKIYLPSFYLEGKGILGDLNPLDAESRFGAGVSGSYGLRYNVDAFGSIGVEHNIVKNLVAEDPVLNRLMIKAAINLW